MKKIADAWRLKNDYGNHTGVVVFFNGEAQGWVDQLRDPQQWQPGCIAVDIQGNEFIATGGNDNDGADSWQLKRMNELCRKCGGACCRDLYLEDRIEIGWATKTLILGSKCPFLKSGLCSLQKNKPEICKNWNCGPLICGAR